MLVADAAHPFPDGQGLLDVARTVERLGYRRIWYAEHHGSPALVAFPPAVAIAGAASATSTIRVGSGGVLAVNQPAVTVAEQFEALSAFFPGRIDLGIGRGPGSNDAALLRALRWGAEPASDAEYQSNVAEILRRVGEQAVPAEPWLLASSPAGAALAARLGVPMAFAYQLRPDNAAESVEIYRREFRPSRWSETPKLMLGVSTLCAETQEAADALGRPAEILLGRIGTRQEPQALLDVAAAAEYQFTDEESAFLDLMRPTIAAGPPEVVRAHLTELADTFAADEIILVTVLTDPKDRAHSYELIMGE
ncbi:MsnO8 family LLM class oxidoreductase [Actinoplanes sp. TBRC 11911]|nr:MsnO8 family LLM class oxidoreductase [Actinoplanes sp. TBRC 11911]